MQNAAFHFQLDGTPAFCEPYGNGHINQTYLLKTDAGRAYVLQRINRHVFRDVPALMRNIAAVTRYLARNGGDTRHVLTLAPTDTGEDYFVDENGSAWRVYHFITDSICLERAQSEEDFFQSGVAFGRFQNMLLDFPAETLTETIPRFHDTPHRYAQLRQAVTADYAGRAGQARAEIDLALSYEAQAGSLMTMLREGRLPLRVTHNDTKLNNVMLDARTRKALCVIDLDTIMPGLVANDFGDSIRFGASTAAEDEVDLQKVGLSLPLFEAYAKGFLSECGPNLTEMEIASLPLGAKLMTLECGVRFLTDYLSGDTYFKTSRAQHNLDRFRTQLKLVSDMEKNWDTLHAITKRASGFLIDKSGGYRIPRNACTPP